MKYSYACNSCHSRLYRLISYSNHVGCKENNPDSQVVTSHCESSDLCHPKFKFGSESGNFKPNDWLFYSNKYTVIHTVVPVAKPVSVMSMCTHMLS